MLGYKLKQLRESKGITRKKVAEFLKIDQSTYGKYELNKRQPDSLTLKQLASYFGVSIDYLLNDKEDKKEVNQIEQLDLNSKDMKEIKQKAEHIKNSLMSAVGLAFDGKIEDEETLELVMKALEEGMILAKKEAKQKYTPKKYRKNK